jgi:hypothetical protein
MFRIKNGGCLELEMVSVFVRLFTLRISKSFFQMNTMNTIYSICGYFICSHVCVVCLEITYRYWCYPMNNMLQIFAFSFITRHSPVCISLRQTIDLIDHTLVGYITHFILLLSSVVLNMLATRIKK